MGSLSSDLQRLELRRLRPTPVRPRSVGGISQSQNTPASTPTMSHSQPELPSAPRGPRVQSFDPWNISFPSPDFQSGLWTAFGTNQTQTNGVASQSSSTPQEIAGTGRNLIDRQTNGNQTHPNAQPWRTGSCCCRSVWITISGPPIVTFICKSFISTLLHNIPHAQSVLGHCNTCKQIFGSDRVSLARYRINVSNRPAKPA
ncbi:hypothetical protein F4806DRAFT_452789 [Annulohypoxylon nitens]|nr:hypothetical protein F4806DRAFT_452789 [Annulohypoxylon nitens]